MTLRRPFEDPSTTLQRPFHDPSTTLRRPHAPHIASDTQNMIDEYERGQDDHLKHAVDLFIDFKVIFTRVLVLLMGRDE